METVMRLKLVNYLKERRLTQSTTAADAGIARGISLLVETAANFPTFPLSNSAV